MPAVEFDGSDLLRSTVIGGRTRRAKSIITAEVNKSFQGLSAVIQSNVIFSAPVGATGQLRNSIESEVGVNQLEVFTALSYAPVIEQGRKAAPVSSSADQALALWIRKSTKGSKWYSNFKSKYPKTTIKQAVYVLKRSMRRKARKPNPFFERGVSQSQGAIKKRIKSLSARIARRLEIDGV